MGSRRSLAQPQRWLGLRLLALGIALGLALGQDAQCARRLEKLSAHINPVCCTAGIDCANGTPSQCTYAPSAQPNTPLLLRILSHRASRLT